jgi:hypothetical protein
MGEGFVTMQKFVSRVPAADDQDTGRNGASPSRRARMAAVGMAAVLVVAVAGGSLLVALMNRPSTGLPASPSQPLSIHPTYSCGGSGPRFNTDVLDGSANAETGTDEAAAALRQAISASPNQTTVYAGGMPEAGWLRVYQTDAEVLFLAPAKDPAYGYDSVAAIRSGSSWTASVSGCWVTPSDDTYTAVGWFLAASPSADSKAVSAAMLYDPANTCAKLVGWTIDYRPDSVTVTLWARILPPLLTSSGQAMGCKLVDSFTLMVVPLSEPLGGRALYDGAKYPVHAQQSGGDHIRPEWTWQP